MQYRKACEEIQSAWCALSGKWSAEIKSRYYSKIYLLLLDEAEGIYRRNADIESYVHNCLQSLGIDGREIQ